MKRARCGRTGFTVAVVALVAIVLTPAASAGAPSGTGTAPAVASASYAEGLGPLGGLVELATRLSLGDPTGAYGSGSGGPRVAMLQRGLARLGYRVGAADGSFGGQTASAVLAFQKVEGLDRDSVAGPAVFARLVAPQGAGPRNDVGGPRIEVDLARQVVFVVGLAGGGTTILNASSGNGETFVLPDTGELAVANTPTGVYQVGYRIDGPEVAPLGTLYRPMYFTGPYAVHGSTSVPAWPASHGCVRVSNPDQDWLYPNTPTGTTVYVY